MNIAKLAALAIVVGMTALPFASCGMIDFAGHELLRNKVPDLDGMTNGLDGVSGGMKSAFASIESGSSDLGSPTFERSPRVKSKSSAKPKELFEGSSRWLHFLYIGLLVLGVGSALIPSGSRAHALIGVIGVAGVILFMNRIGPALTKEPGAEGASMARIIIDWEIGAYATIAGFVALIYAGLFAARPPTWPPQPGPLPPQAWVPHP